MSSVCRIKRLANGYEVEITDPKIVEQNRKSKGDWKSPEISYAFKTVDEVLAFLKANLAKAMPMDDYESSFDMAAKEEDEKDE